MLNRPCGERHAEKEKNEEREWQQCLESAVSELDVNTTSKELASEILVPNIQMPISKFREMVERLDQENKGKFRFAIRIDGLYFLFNSLDETLLDSKVKEHLRDLPGLYPHNIRVREIKFRIDCEDGSLTFARSVALKGKREWVLQQRKVIVNSLTKNYRHGYGKTPTQASLLALRDALSFIGLLILLLYGYLFLYFNPHLFPAFLSLVGVKSNEILVVISVYLVSMFSFILIFPSLLTFKIIERLNCWDLGDYANGLVNNKLDLALSDLLLSISLIVFDILIYFAVFLFGYNFFSGSLNQQAGIQNLTSDLIPIGSFISTYWSTILAISLTVIALMISVPLYWDWRSKRLDTWGDSEDLWGRKA